MAAFDKKADVADRIPELRTWNDGEGVDIETWIACEGDHKHLIGYARILWPDFVEYDGCVFLGESMDELSERNYQSWLAKTEGDKKRVEAVMNHQHILDLFSRSHHERPSREVVIYIGRLMKDILYTKLSSRFPGRNFVVQFAEDGVEDLADYQITFFQER